MYGERSELLCCKMLLKLPLVNSSINVSYVEILDETNYEMNHVHDSFELCICLENKLRFIAGGHEHELLPGDFLLIMRGTPHNVVYNLDEKKKYFTMIFDLPYIDKYDERYRPLVTKVDKLSHSALSARGICSLDKTMAILREMENELVNKNTGWVFLLRGYCLQILIHSLREVISPSQEIVREANNMAIDIIKYMQNHHDKKITLADISSALHISPRHAQRIFAEYFGVSCTKALNLYRLNTAKNYLTRTELPLAEIAELVGLSSTQSLNKLFIENERLSASEYKAIQATKSDHL